MEARQQSMVWRRRKEYNLWYNDPVSSSCPSKMKFLTSGHALYLPTRQNSHDGLEHGTPASITTRSPFTHSVTPSPTSITSPAASCPRPSSSLTTAKRRINQTRMTQDDESLPMVSPILGVRNDVKQFINRFSPVSYIDNKPPMLPKVTV